MRAVTIQQPWAWAIFHARPSPKNVENRTWATRHRGPLLIHAGRSRASYDAQDARVWRERYGCDLPRWCDLPVGAIIGVVDVVDCVRPVWVLPERVDVPGIGPSVWAEPDGYAWVLANPRPFAEPIPCRGMMGLFGVDSPLIRGQLR